MCLYLHLFNWLKSLYWSPYLEWVGLKLEVGGTQTRSGPDWPEWVSVIYIICIRLLVSAKYLLNPAADLLSEGTSRKKIMAFFYNTMGLVLLPKGDITCMTHRWYRFLKISSATTAFLGEFPGSWQPVRPKWSAANRVNNKTLKTNRFF